MDCLRGNYEQNCDYNRRRDHQINPSERREKTMTTFSFVSGIPETSFTNDCSIHTEIIMKSEIDRQVEGWIVCGSPFPSSILKLRF